MQRSSGDDSHFVLTKYVETLKCSTRVVQRTVLQTVLKSESQMVHMLSHARDWMIQEGGRIAHTAKHCTTLEQ